MPPRTHTNVTRRNDESWPHSFFEIWRYAWSALKKQQSGKWCFVDSLMHFVCGCRSKIWPNPLRGMLLGCLKTLERPYQILDWYWALAFLWQNNNIAKCADGRDGKPHSKGSKFLISKCFTLFFSWLIRKTSPFKSLPKMLLKKTSKTICPANVVPELRKNRC